MSISKPTHMPQEAGVYIFYRKKIPIYIGKAANIKKRLSSYFKKDAGEKVRMLLNEADRLEWIKTVSEVEALLKEAELIKKHIPKYNIVMRDDKNYFYVAITKEDFPRIFLTHQPFASDGNKKLIIGKRNGKTGHKIKYLGPFTSGSAIKEVLRMLRRLFPYCTCKEAHKRPCLNAEIGRCPGYCCLTGTRSGVQNTELKEKKKEYENAIKKIIAVLNGRKKNILRELKKEMRFAAKRHEFERAAKIRDQIEGLENVFSHAVLNNGRIHRPFNWVKIRQNLKTIFGISISRVEGYDISNISGTEAVGSMVVFIDGLPAKSEYRKFRIRSIFKPDDVGMHKEIARRRLRHPEWPLPDLILIDGGRPQLNVALSVFAEHRAPSIQDSGPYKTKAASSVTAIAALAKREEELYVENKKDPIPLKNLPSDTAFFFQRLRDESHRFAKKYHHKRREITYAQTKI